MSDNSPVNPFPIEIEARFERGELIAAIAQSAQDHQVLMLAWMNREALARTIATKRATYWSRSRNSLWVKGEESGNFQEVLSISYDCDGDAILLIVHQHGVTCHTGSYSCFSHKL